ncbi:MAG: hypothetical protein HY826_15170, partial [Actinobacteria bacterium]|nr:hypothetical protein [Actinomycetota bacterium]
MRVIRLLTAAAPPILLVAACSGPAPRDEATYCGQVASHLTDLNTPVIADAIDIGQLLIAWQEVANSAPLAVEAEWNTMIDAMETAATVDP